MKTSVAKRSKKTNSRQAELELRKAQNQTLKPEEIERIIALADGPEYVVIKPYPQIPGYTYAF
ncbi:hypothetical protein [Hymenobacter sp.]|jgi:hypothetical protein|uniref:hypothetical protein n=1 Tax=Hymenobacter sp. TaxID=1898978 RepID=UPI002EDB0E33